MIKFKEYLNNLNAFTKKFPEVLEYQVIYSHDDEGNEYQRVINGNPSVVQLHDPEQKGYRFLEIVGFLGEDDIERTDCNAIVIN